MNTINYSKLAEAIELYSAAGYRTIEVPWRITTDVLNITKPPEVLHDDYIIAGTGKGLLASGEQAFLYLANKGMLPFGKYQTVTPCFRNEPYDRYHSKQFMKLELIELVAEPPDDYQFITTTALSVFRKLAGSHAGRIKFVLVEDNDIIAYPGTSQIDIVFTMQDGRDVELGSYGMRKTNFATWIYGTGLAEPRFSRALQEYEQFI